MEYVNLGKTGLKVSRIAMGGHEYLQDGRSRGFNEDREKSLTPGALTWDLAVRTVKQC